MDSKQSDERRPDTERLQTTEAGDGRLRGCVVDHKPLGSLVWLTLEVPGWKGAEAGQFALLQPEPSSCFLARALSIAGEVGECVSFLVAPVGEGTRELCGLAPGNTVWVVGPLGNGFDMEALFGSPGRVLIVAGGVGVALFPLFLSRLAKDLEGGGAWSGLAPPQLAKPERAGRRIQRLEVLVLLGFRDADQCMGAAPVEEAVWRMKRAGLPCRLDIATEDGSRGRAETVTDLLERHLVSGDRLAVCGAWEMSQAVWRVCATVPRVAAWFSLEANMACGVGSCHGCAISLADGSYARVCRDGPVFAGEDVFGA